jgi:hypothetical protein
MRNFTWEMNSIGKVLVFYTDEMLEMCNVPIRISCQTNDLFSPIKKKSHFKLFPNFTIFRSTFPIFFLNLIRTITNILKKEFVKLVQAFSSDALNQEHHSILKFSNFLRNFLNFSFRKNLLRSIRKH